MIKVPIIIMQNQNDPTILSNWRKVAIVEDFYTILREIHCVEKGHIGEKKTVMEASLYCHACAHYLFFETRAPFTHTQSG